MLRVMIVDDEPFIALGISKIINWKDEGYEVAHIAYNGREAMDYLAEHEVELIVADIQMPVMNGLELLEEVRKTKAKLEFIILSGYSDFAYAQRAIRSSCTEYLLKPVQKEELLRVIREIAHKYEQLETREMKNKEMERIYNEHNFKAILSGKFDDHQLDDFIVQNPIFENESHMRYVHIYSNDIMMEDDLEDEERLHKIERVYQECKTYLGKFSDCCILEYIQSEGEYMLGFVFCQKMAKERGQENNEYLENLLAYLQKELGMELVFIAGKPVEQVSKLYRSYSSAFMLRSFQGFCMSQAIYYYEEVINTRAEGVVLCVESLDQLINAVSLNEKGKIKENVDLLFDEMEHVGFNEKNIAINTNYLLFRLIYLAVEQDEGINQEEVMRYISESTFERGINRGSRVHLTKFANEYADYIIQLRKNVSRGILGEIEKEIHQNYAQNLTLRGLSQKYYVNSSYLGQIFRKKYGVSFKDYLSEFRIEKASYKLIQTDLKISHIAEEVGYKDLDYFITKFIEKKGVAPAKYRRQMLDHEKS